MTAYVKLTSGVTGTGVPADTDHIPYTDNSGAAILKKTLWSSIKTALITVMGTALTGSYLPLAGGTMTGNIATGIQSISGTAVTINDDAYYAFTPGATGYGIVMMHSRNNASYSLYHFIGTYRTAATAYMQSMVSGTSTIVGTIGALSGTTGTDGNFTISAHTNGSLYFENRTGANLSMGIKILGS